MKKLVSLFLALLMLMTAGAFAETVDMSEPMDIEIMAYFVMDVDPDTDPVMMYLEDKFNVNFKISLTNIDNYADTLNMRIASGDIPDWFRINNQSVYGQLQEDEVLLNVSEMVEKYGFENIKATLEGPNASVLATDGVFYRVPDTIGKLVRGTYFRQDWLDELGLKEPTNFDELYEVLKAIVEADPDGNGTTGFTCYGLWCLEGLAPSWVGYNTWGQDADGNIMWWYEDDNYKDYMKYLNKLYAEGLLDNELFINSYETCMEKLATGRAGYYMMNMNAIWWSNNKTMLANTYPDAELGAAIPMIEGPGGALAARDLGFSADSAFSADLDEAKAARILAIMDYLLSDEGRDLTLYGYEEGKYYDTVDGKKVQKEDVVNLEWGQTLHFMGEIADFGTGDRLATDPTVLEWYDYVGDTENCAYNVTNYFYNEDASVIMADLNEIVTRYLTGFVTGEIDIEEGWATMQDELDAAGLEDYKALLKEYCDAQGIVFDSAI